MGICIHTFLHMHTHIGVYLYIQTDIQILSKVWPITSLTIKYDNQNFNYGCVPLHGFYIKIFFVNLINFNKKASLSQPFGYLKSLEKINSVALLSSSEIHISFYFKKMNPKKIWILIKLNLCFPNLFSWFFTTHIFIRSLIIWNINLSSLD